MDEEKRGLGSRSIFSGVGVGGGLRRSPSEMALYELFASVDDENFQNRPNRIFGGSGSYIHDLFSVEDGDRARLALDNSEKLKEFSGSNSFAGNTSICSQSLYAKQSKFSLPIDSQSSICAGSPLSANVSKGGDNQVVEDSSDEQSDDDFDIETEAGSCEQNKSPIDIKRFKRHVESVQKPLMVSNRESARRSRRRKQAHLTDLEKQAEELRGENAALYKQLVDATQRFKDSTTNNRVLRSDVEALRAKVKLAEDMIARGSLTSSLSHLLQNYLTVPQDYANNNTSFIGPPIMAPHIGDNNSTHNEISGSTIGIQNAEPFNSVLNGVIGEVSTWESHIK
ncbi:basic-leucine zipper transcription factor family protein [Striga asiatica]|uniref:Basic-leucine zipper transcription factor family protein n=1 Tax=Striga asiatica TaxID=4170 RepID=A0A5A7QWY6_STRAF|nr:basic-leucine zipper transcription factor family protein [Striga asiatica]